MAQISARHLYATLPNLRRLEVLIQEDKSGVHPNIEWWGMRVDANFVVVGNLNIFGNLGQGHHLYGEGELSRRERKRH